MTKYYRRAGTIAYRYIIQAEIEKIELKVPATGPYPQRISVIFKRGDVLRETKNAPLVEGGIAYFNEKLSLPATIYYDTRKKAYLQKEATLAVNVYSKRATKLMGVTKFDLAPFINQNIKEQNIVLKMDKCSDKNAKFFLKISMNQIMELGASKRSSKHSFKDITKNSSIRGSIKETQLTNVSEIEEHEERIKEESKIHFEGLKEDDQMDDLYSYYTGSNSPSSQAKLKEIEDTMGEVIRTPKLEKNSSTNEPNFKFDSAQKFYAFDQLESESPQKIETSLLEDEIESTELEGKADIMKKESSQVSNSLCKSNQSFHGLRSEYEQLRKAYSALEQKYEAAVKNQEFELQNSNENSLKINLYESRILELEKRCREAEGRNDLLTRKVEELDQINTEYLTQIKGYVEQQNQFAEVQQYDANQFEMKEILQKLVEANNTIVKNEEIYALEKENAQKQIQALELNIQRLIKENEQYNQKQKPKNLGASFDNTGLHASFKTREESIIEDNEDTSKFIPNDMTDRHQEVSHILDRSGIENSKLAEISALKQEIKELSSKLSAAGNLQNKYDQEVQKKGIVEQELKSLKKELDKANKGWSYAEEERYELASKLKEYEDGSKMNKKVDMLETELFKLKAKLCEVMNVALEFGRADMLDRIESIMSTNELSDLRSSIGKQSFWD